MPEGLVSLSHGPLHYRHAPCTRSRAVAVLLHGLLATSFGWRATLAALSTRCNSFALDLPGLAASAPLPGYRASLARLAGCVAEFWQARGLPRGVLIGSSWGGAVALETAARFPHLIDRLVLAAPLNPFFRPNWRQRLLLRPRLARYGAELLRRAPRRLYAAGFAAMWSGPRPLPPEMLAGYWRPLRQARLGAVVAGMVASWHEDLRALAARLPAIDVPTLLIWGREDRVVPPDSAPLLRSALPRADLVWLPGAGHLSFEERPEDFNAALLRFLA
ncbi:MAG TPA: alpha/beta hydrolase [Terriglobales bacterium]|nr:alpha/beta hydrolase [Terriglobales bacterium]